MSPGSKHVLKKLIVLNSLSLHESIFKHESDFDWSLSVAARRSPALPFFVGSGKSLVFRSLDHIRCLTGLVDALMESLQALSFEEHDGPLLSECWGFDEMSHPTSRSAHEVTTLGPGSHRSSAACFFGNARQFSSCCHFSGSGEVTFRRRQFVCGPL